MENRGFDNGSIPTEHQIIASTRAYQEYCEYMHGIHLYVGKLPLVFLANIIVNAVFLVVTILGNSAVLYAILKTPTLHSPSVTLLAGLACSDLGVGLIVQPLYVLMRTLDLQGHFYCSLATVFDVTAYFLCSTSFLIVSAVSVDRYLALYLHLRYATIVTTKRVLRCLTFLCIISMVVCTSKLWNIHVFVVLVVVFIVGCLFTSSLAYYKIYCIVRYHKARIKCSETQPAESRESETQPERQGASNSNSSVITRHKKSAVSMFYVFCLLLACYFPFLCCRAFLELTSGRSSTKQAVFEAAVTVVYTNSLLNPLMYCWRLRDIRTAIIQTICDRSSGNDRTLSAVSRDRTNHPEKKSTKVRVRSKTTTRATYL